MRSPTLSLTLSCAEYESHEVSNYLRKVNSVSDSYPIGKLCTEDPVSVSRKFSQKFHDFFDTVILNGGVLGPVAHYFYEKEYQARGAPHYHIILWIEGAPTAGEDDSEEVLRWIQRESLAVFQRKRAIQSCISWSPNTSTTSAAITVDGGNG